MAAAELDRLQRRAGAKPSAWSASQMLTLVREARLPRRDLVLQLGERALSALSTSSRTYWDFMAQICAAAAHEREFEMMESVMSRIIARFPHSPRAFALVGRTREVRAGLSSAMDTYISVLDKAPMSPVIYKRQVALLKSEKKLPEAVALLNYYISHYSDDSDAWAELCALCLALGRFSHALFAASELVATDPKNHAYQTLAAEVYITCGGKDNLLRAREHYASSLAAKRRGNLRALYGLWLACSRLLDNALLDKEEEARRNEQLLAVAQAGIKAVYDKLREESGSAAAGSAALVLINSDIVTGKRRSKNVS